jgi:hypothetical protein
MTEWPVAAFLLYRYGTLINRPDVKRFALLMIPHWCGGMCVLAYHTTGDSVSFWLDASKILNLMGSVSLLYASLSILFRQMKRSREAGLALTKIGAGCLMLIPMTSDVMLRSTLVNFAFQLSSVIYLLFLVSLLVLYRFDKEAFGKLTIFGFWFLLVFVAVAAVCNYYAVKVHGYPTLTHDDVLHGFAESFLTISNLIIVIGVRKQILSLKTAQT